MLAINFQVFCFIVIVLSSKFFALITLLFFCILIHIMRLKVVIDLCYTREMFQPSLEPSLVYTCVISNASKLFFYYNFYITYFYVIICTNLI
jgi:hypothetical protein